MQKINVFLIISAVILLFGTVNVTAQSMEIIDDLLLAETADFGSSVYMIAVGSGLADESVSISEAVDLISENKWNKSRKKADDPISLGELSFITMKALKMHGGLMYSLMPSSRYAVRELAYLGLIEGEAHPGNKVNGEDVLNILSQAIALKEAK
jgi:hypothetical protein